MQGAKLELVYVHRGGCVGVAQISILCKTSNFTSISWDFDVLSTKTRHAPYNVWSSKHPPAGCTLDGNVIVTDQKDVPSFWEWPPPSPRNNWGPRCVLFFPFFYEWVSFFFFFSPEQDKFFFSLPMWVKFVFFFFPFYVWVKFFFFFFFFLPLSRSSLVFFFFNKNFLLPLEV